MGDARLEDALQSLAVQTRRDFEVIVVDMSGGGHAAALAHFATVLPSLRIVALPPSARPAALNAGIAAAAAPVIGILDHDNLYDPEQVDLFLNGLASTNADYVYTGVDEATYTRDGRWMASRRTGRPFSFDDLVGGNYIHATGSAFLRSLWERVGGYDPRFDVLEDWDFLLRAAGVGTISYLGCVAGESRKFTGIEGRSMFELETASVRRCKAGIYWKHRRLYLRQFIRRMSGPNPLRRARRALTHLRGLGAWLVHNLRNDSRSH